MVSEWVQSVMAGKAWQQVWEPSLTDRKQIDSPDSCGHGMLRKEQEVGAPVTYFLQQDSTPQKIQLS